MLKTVVFLVVIGALGSCGSSKPSSTSQTNAEEYKSIAIKKLGEDALFLMNEDDTFVLCINETKGTVQQPRNSINYLVVKTSDASVAIEGTVNGGTVGWYNLKMIQVFRTPGIMRADQSRDDFITLYNVETGKSHPKNLKETH